MLLSKRVHNELSVSLRGNIMNGNYSSQVVHVRAQIDQIGRNAHVAQIFVHI